MKTLSAFVFACVLGSALASQSAGLTFSVVKPEHKKHVMKITGIERKALENAVRLHNLIVDVRGLDELRTQLRMALKTQELQVERLDALERCSVNKLSEQFKQPEEVWEKMKAEYAKREKDLTIYVNSAENATEDQLLAFQRYMDHEELTPDMVSEIFSPWRIGSDILMDVYQNQDAWGERKSEKAPSFPLWKDQKYQFDQEWDSTYTKINAYFGVPPQGRPIIGDERYDYARAKDVEKAHNEYLALLTAKSPLKAAALPPSLRKPPVAPKPLPPKIETVIYLEAQNPENQFYPSLPETWKKYAKDNFKNVNPQGEMAEDFSSGLNLKESAKNAGNQTNRLVAYSALQQTVESTEQVSNIVLTNAEAHVDHLRRQIAQYIPITPDADLINPDVQAQVLTQLLAKETQLIEAADIEMQKRVAEEEDERVLPELDISEIEDIAALKEINPAAFEEIQHTMPTSFYEQDKNLLAALKADSEGQVFLNEVNAGEVDKMMRESEATKAFLAEQDDWEKALAMERALPIDDTCLNGGI